MPAAARRLRWRTELPLLALVYGLYSAARLVARGDVGTAVGHGLAILHAEETLRLNAEHPLNRLFTAEAWLGIPAAYAYAALHYLVTPAVLVWLWHRRPADYRRMRAWLMISTLIGLVGFTLFPTCPPRLLDPAYGFVDTMAQYGDYGWWGAEASAPQGLGGLTNQYAAMPSLHVGWALWCGAVTGRHSRGPRWARALAFGYPLVIVLIVMGTANHYFLDAAAGAAVMALGLLLTRPVLRCADALRDRCAAVRRARKSAAARGGTAAGAVDVGTGCQTSRRTALTREAPGATADDDIPRQHGREHGREQDRQQERHHGGRHGGQHERQPERPHERRHPVAEPADSPAPAAR